MFTAVIGLRAKSLLKAISSIIRHVLMAGTQSPHDEKHRVPSGTTEGQKSHTWPDATFLPPKRSDKCVDYINADIFHCQAVNVPDFSTYIWFFWISLRNLRLASVFLCMEVLAVNPHIMQYAPLIKACMCEEAWLLCISHEWSCQTDCFWED